MTRLTLERIKAAHNRIQDFVKRTPLVHSATLSKICGGEIFLKLENQQLTNTFKIRGAFNRMSLLSQAERNHGVVTASSGNHAQAVALAAQKLGLEATIVVPKHVAEIKLERIRSYEVKIVLEGEFDEVESIAREIAQKENKVYISPYNDTEIMAGQGTIGLEILQDLDKIDTIIVPVGGGGLVAGIVLAVKELAPDITVLGVQTHSTATMFHSLKAGRIVKFEEGETFAEAFLGGVEMGSLTFDVIKDLVDDIILVDEEYVVQAIQMLWKSEKQVVEGAGATAICPILETPELFRKKHVVAIISGGNIDDSLFKRIISDI